MSSLCYSKQADAKTLRTTQAAPVILCFGAAAVAGVDPLGYVLDDDERPVDSPGVGKLVGVAIGIAPEDVSVVRDVASLLVTVDEEATVSETDIELSETDRELSDEGIMDSDDDTVVSEEEGASDDELSTEVTRGIVDVAVLSVVNSTLVVVCASGRVIEAVVVSGTRPPVRGATA